MLKVMDGPARLRIDAGLVKQLRTKGTMVLDGRRRRPRYFDGRFLAARDLTREQTYFLSRQASLGRAMGVGVIDGLMVGPGSGASTLQIAGGHGLTTNGEAVGLRRPMDVDLGDVAESERLSAAFGLLRRPAAPARARTGLFILALRAVEFTANPVASYPTSVDGDRSLEHGDIIEASAITLIPYPDDSAEEEPALRRAHVARKIFVEGVHPGVPAGVLPLAMLSLDRNVVQWIDNFMVRRGGYRRAPHFQPGRTFRRFGALLRFAAGGTHARQGGQPERFYPALFSRRARRGAQHRSRG